MSVSIEQIKELRAATGVSMTACKKALEEANGDFDAAVDILRKKGQAKAAAKSDRTTGEGAVIIAKDGNKAAIVKLLCETDFMAKNEEFLNLGKSLAEKLLKGEISPDQEEIPEVKEAVLKLGENIQMGEMSLVEADGVVIGEYIHSNRKIGVLTALKNANDELAKDIAMHIAASNPQVISPDEIGDDLVASEKNIWIEQLKSEGKPEEIIEKILMGKEKKFREENALIKQAFVKDPEKTIEQLLTPEGAEIISFVRFNV